MSPTWNVHIGAVDIFPRGQIPTLLAIRSNSLLSRPGLVSPREQHEEQLVDDVGIRDVEVMLES